MVVTLFGIQDVDFVTDDGKKVTGMNLFVGYQSRFVTGQITKKYFVSDQASFYQGSDPLKSAIGTDIDLVFNDRGRIEDIELLN